MTGGGAANFGTGGMEILGGAGTGIFNQTGGTNVCTTQLDVGGSHYGLLSTPLSPGYGTYTLSGSASLLTAGDNGEKVGTAGTGVFTQTGGSNVTPSLILGGWSNTNGYTSQSVNTPGTYNLNGGVLQTNYISVGQGAATFNFTAGTLQGNPQGTAGGSLAPQGWLANCTAITVGPAASNVATVDAAGYGVMLNANDGISAGYLTGPGQLRVIDSVGGGTVILGGTDSNFPPSPTPTPAARRSCPARWKC